jgi:ammonia channel protein AmtB
MNAGDTAWVLVCTALVMLMVPGLALFYGGAHHRGDGGPAQVRRLRRGR